MAGADEGVFTKLVLVSAAGDDMIVVISINATEEGGKCQKIKDFYEAKNFLDSNFKFEKKWGPKTGSFE